MKRFAAACASLVFLGAQALAQDDGTPAATSPPPPCASEPYHAFDFWIGEWTVTDPATGQLAGTNSIQPQENGCLLVERWSGAGGSSGQSYNYFDPGKKVWRQLWISASSVIDYEGGLNQVGAMVLEGKIHYRNGTSFDFRGTWTPHDDGSVTQYFQQYNPDTRSWDDWFTGLYRKSK